MEGRLSRRIEEIDEGSGGKGWERRRGRWTRLVAAHKPTLRTITVTNHIVFVATTHRNTS